MITTQKKEKSFIFVRIVFETIMSDLKKHPLYCDNCDDCYFFCCPKCGDKLTYKPDILCCKGNCISRDHLTRCEQCGSAYCWDHNAHSKHNYMGNPSFYNRVRTCSEPGCELLVCRKCWYRVVPKNSYFEWDQLPVYCKQHKP